jgi:hypothetical protein
MAAGYQALNNAVPPTASGSGSNIAIGANALYAITTGGQNIAIGTDALRKVTSGIRNIALGFRSLGGSDFYAGGVTTGTNNIAIGHYSLGLTTGSRNTGVG